MSSLKDERTPIMDVRCVSYQYPEAPQPALQDVSFTLYPGDRVLVIGHNGSGKSTLLSLLGGRRKPQRGKAGAPSASVKTDETNVYSRFAPRPGSHSDMEDDSRGVIRVLGGDPFDDTSMAKHIALIGSPWPTEAFFGNTVDRIASPAPEPARKTAIAEALHLRLSRWVDKMSSGEKRRVQILHGMLSPESRIFLLDECSTDIDVAERKTVLDLVRKECEEREGCCLYATHILDRVHDWATHLLLMKEGRVMAFVSVAELTTAAAKLPGANGNGNEVSPDMVRQAQDVSLEQFALRFMASGSTSLQDWTSGLATQSFLERGRGPTADPSSQDDGAGADKMYFANKHDREHPQACTEVVIDCAGLTYRDVFHKASFQVYRGERVLLCGCNGAGKSTLLNMLGGKQYFNNTSGALRVLGKVCYDDMTLNAQVSYGGDWWTSVPGGEVHVREMLTISTPRAERLRSLLAVNVDWDVRHISSGEQKRVQILLYLLEDKPIVLLDEATADLDVDQRHALLSFLYAESVCRGVTVVYSTHIFGGLSGWADTIVLLDRTVRGVHAVWRARNGDSVDLDRVTEELVALKAREVF